MSRRLSIAMALFLGVMLTVSLAASVQGQPKEAKGKAAAKQDRLDGTVQTIDKATKTFTLRPTGSSTLRQVVYTESTKFTVRNKPGSLDEVEIGRRVISLGKFNDKGQLIAARIDVRATR